jgi:hypothetical protein
MSYSFNVKGATPAVALELAAAEMAKVVASQPCHAQDQAQALAAAKAVMEPLITDDSKDVSLSVTGSVTWGPPYTIEPGKEKIVACTISVAASLVPRA